MDGLNFLQKCKFEAAWKKIVPNPQAAPAQIQFLGDEERDILNTLNERFSDVSKDIELIQKTSDSFNESAALAKKNVNEFAQTMIAMINARKDELLKQIDEEKKKNQAISDKNLDKLYALNGKIKQNKDLFTHIASDVNITSKERSIRFRQLLQIAGVDYPVSICDKLQMSFK